MIKKADINHTVCLGSYYVKLVNKRFENIFDCEER